MKKITSINTDAESLLDAAVEDSTGAPVGVLTGLWSDSSSSQIRYLEIAGFANAEEVQIVPVGNSKFDDYRRLVRVSYPFSAIQSAPTVRPSPELSAAIEQQIREHFGKTHENSAEKPSDPAASLDQPVSDAEAEVGTHPFDPPRRSLRKIVSKAMAAPGNEEESPGEEVEEIPRLDEEAETFESLNPDLRRVWDRQRRSPTEL
jgi:hypothetical protein